MNLIRKKSNLCINHTGLLFIFGMPAAYTIILILCYDSHKARINNTKPAMIDATPSIFKTTLPLCGFLRLIMFESVKMSPKKQ